MSPSKQPMRLCWSAVLDSGFLIGGDVLRLLHGHMDECLTVPSGEHGEEQRRSVSRRSWGEHLHCVVPACLHEFTIYGFPRRSPVDRVYRTTWLSVRCCYGCGQIVSTPLTPCVVHYTSMLYFSKPTWKEVFILQIATSLSLFWCHLLDLLGGQRVGWVNDCNVVIRWALNLLMVAVWKESVVWYSATLRSWWPCYDRCILQILLQFGLWEITKMQTIHSDLFTSHSDLKSWI